VFGLSLTDHLRLTFGHVVYSHRAHTITADRHARWNRWLKTAEALLMLTTAVASAAVVFTVNPQHAIGAAVAATLAMAVLILRLAFDFERTAIAHRACSTQLWHLREQYRGVLSDLKDGVLSLEDARDRRDYLMATLHRIYENAPPADREHYQSAKQSLAAVNEATLTDEEIDRFLPPSLQKTDSAAQASTS
jgi:SMODS and SLOG-associating 2TM effector domain family 4